jgi:glycosyltransferase involved in cell wall biosynthesis
MSKVTIITATVGNPRLADCILSVRNQTHADIDHLLVCDGRERETVVIQEFDRALQKQEGALKHVKPVWLPYSIGKDRWNGHRIYAAGAFMADGDYVMYLDDDNTLEPDHIESLLTVCETNDWAYSLRNIVDKDGKFLCQDNCESLGKWASVLDEKDFFIDVNCYFLPTRLAIHLGPAWYRKFREPGMPEVDRVLAATLMNNNLKFECTYEHTVNYTVGNTENSVKKEFFENGNRVMRDRYPDGLPWKSPELPL